MVVRISDKTQNYSNVTKLLVKPKLKYLEGYTLDEIAKIQNTNSNTIKSRLFESRKKLKDKLKGSGLYE